MITYQLKNLKKNISDFNLSITDCRLKQEGIYAVIGPNGCGKSTFLNILSFLDIPSEGKLEFKGKYVDYNSVKDVFFYRRKVGYLLQNPYLFNMSVTENVGYGLKIRRVPAVIIQEKVGQILERFSLSSLAHRKPDQLSGGEAQRVALARTLVLEADVFLLDEPTANVDKKNIKVVEKLILSINKEKKATIVFTTHVQEQAYRMSQNIISIINGQIKDIAYENVFSGKLEEEKDGLKYMCIAEKVSLKLSRGIPGEITVAIDPQDIILSKERFDSSALNSFYGKIEKIENINGSLRIFVDVGVSFCALITHRSFQDMGLNIGVKVWATFKANSIKVV
ncbi:MAG: ABC transporter ATP-binding protein [Candidatus Omnitrophica bacterium]|nr:ABC transporter ATP-binding protein [Candidatus Omnitrophota bacterium]